MLLDQVPARALFAWTLDDGDLEFEDDSSYPTTTITGPPPNAPRTIAAGRWAVGLGIGQGSDVPDQPAARYVLCVREFDVTPGTGTVAISANFDPPCSIEIEFDPAPEFPTTETPAATFTPPPEGGTMDDCHYRTVLLQIDSDGLPWYEEVESGQRIEIATAAFADWSVVQRGTDAELVGPDGHSLPELYLEEVTCVFKAGDVAWVGDPDEQWLPWYGALPEDEAGYTVRWMLELARGHPGGSPPAAATVTSATARPDRATLRTLDAEVRKGGDQRWSIDQPGFWLGHAGSMEIPGSVGTFGSELWAVYAVGGGIGEGSADGWLTRHRIDFVTPAGNTVSTLGETLTIWEDCSKLDFSTITPGPIEPGYESGIDVEGGLVQVWVDDADRDGQTLVVASYVDEACREHPILGPIIEHLLADEVEPASP